MRNRAIFASNPTSAKRESDQTAGNAPPEDHRQHLAGPEAPAPSTTGTQHHLHPVDTTTATTKEDESSTTKAPKVKYIFVFAVFGLRFSRENTKAHQIKSNFCPFLLKICPDCLKICHDESGKGTQKAG